MALARSRQAARRVKDRWKAKQWYKVVAPASFHDHVIAETLADDPVKLQGRRLESTLQDFTGDMRQMHVKLYFQVQDVQDRTAKAAFVGHAMTSDYVRRLTRRGNTKIPLVLDLKTKDGSRVRVKPFAISDRRCQTTQAEEIRRTMTRMLQEAASTQTLNGFLHEVLIGELNQKIFREARKIHPLRRIEIAKTEILKAPTVETDETPVIAAPQAEEPETEGDEPESTSASLDDTEDSEDETLAATDSEEE